MKKFIALLCTLCMIATMMVPFSAFAAGETIWTSWDGSCELDNAVHKFQVSTATVTERTFPTDVIGGNSGPYMQFKTVPDTTSKDEALIYGAGIPQNKQYVALSLNVYGKALDSIYSRYDGTVKPWVAQNIAGKLVDGRWNNVFVVFNVSTKVADLYINGSYESSENFYTYLENKGFTVNTENGTYGDSNTAITMSGVRFKFARNTKASLTWNVDDLCVFTSDSEITPAAYATLTSDAAYINGNDILIKIGYDSAELTAEGAKIMVNGAEGSVVKTGDEVVVVTSTPYGNIYSAPYTVAADTVDAIYDGSALAKDFYLDATGGKLADLDARWRVANINEGVAAGVTDSLGGKTNDSYLQFSGSGELNIHTISNAYSTRYFALSINVYGKNLRDIWSRLNSGSNKVSLVAEGNKYGGHLTGSLTADAWNNVFFVFDSQTKTSKTYINGEFFKSANLYNTIETALSGTVDREAGTATANSATIDANFMNLKKDIRFLFIADGTTINVDDIATIYADYEPTPAALAEVVAVSGAKVSGNSIYMEEGAETAEISAEGATIMVDSGEGYAEGATIKEGDKVVVVNSTPYGNVYDCYTVSTPVYGTYESFGAAGVKWSYADGVLRIYGKGEMPAVADNTYANRPWQSYVNDITKIIVEEGITKIAAKSFMLMSNLTEIDIPGTVANVGGYAFQSCSKLDNVVFPEGVKTIDQHIFHSANGVKTITLPSTFATGATAVFNSKANTIATINVPWYGDKAIAWAENYKANKNTAAVINVSNDSKEGYLSDTDGVEKAFKWEVVPETGVLTIEKTSVASNSEIQTFADHVPGQPVELLAPWHYVALNGKITSVVVGEGIKLIPSQVLRENGAYATVTLPSTLTSASNFAFNAAKISELYIKEGANFTGGNMINDNSDVEKIIFPSTMTPAQNIIRDFTFGSRKGMSTKDIILVAPYASPAYAWAEARKAEATAAGDGYVGMPAANITILPSYEITGNSEGAVTVANNTGYAVDSAYVIVAYYDDAELSSLSAAKLSDVQTLASESNAVNVETYADAEGKTVRVFLWNNLDDLKPMAAVFGE